MVSKKEISQTTQVSLESQVAVLNEAVSTLKRIADSNHEKYNDMGKQLGLIRLDIQRNTTQIQHALAEQSELKIVVENNTDAVNSIHQLLSKILIERDTTKTNISTFSKVVLWIIAVGGAVAATYQAAVHWFDGYS